MNFHWWKLQVRREVCVFQRLGMVDRLSDDHLGSKGTAGDGGATPECFELGIFDNPVFNFQLQLYYVTAGSLATSRT